MNRTPLSKRGKRVLAGSAVVAAVAITGAGVTLASSAALTKKIAERRIQMSQFGKPGMKKQSDYCGKGQYKSLECKAKSIQKAAIERGYATEAEAPYIGFLVDNGMNIKSAKEAKARGYDPAVSTRDMRKLRRGGD
jgi:hypothetical protein